MSKAEEIVKKYASASPAQVRAFKMNLWNIDDIDEYQLEVTSHCNAACPMCTRNLSTGGINPYLPVSHLSLEDITRTFTKDHVKKIRQIFFCGGYGDPIVHPKFLDICKYFRKHNPELWLYIHTNGGVRTPEWFAELADIMHGYGQIDFGIDGLEDTNHLYRKNVQFKKVIQNAKGFIDAGGRAQWNFIVFKHNQHQVDEVKQLANNMNFFNVLIRNTGRFLNQETMEYMNHWGNLEPPTIKKYRNPSSDRADQATDEYFKTTKITCDSLTGKKVAIMATGIVMPCNMLAENLYDARFHDYDLPGKHHLSETDGKNQVQVLVEKWGEKNINIKHNSLEDIFKNGMWQEIKDRWKDNSLFECAFTCGDCFNKCWDQGGTTR